MAKTSTEITERQFHLPRKPQNALGKWQFLHFNLCISSTSRKATQSCFGVDRKSHHQTEPVYVGNLWKSRQLRLGGDTAVTAIVSSSPTNFVGSCEPRKLRDTKVHWLMIGILYFTLSIQGYAVMIPLFSWGLLHSPDNTGG